MHYYGISSFGRACECIPRISIKLTEEERAELRQWHSSKVVRGDTETSWKHGVRTAAGTAPKNNRNKENKQNIDYRVQKKYNYCKVLCCGVCVFYYYYYYYYRTAVHGTLAK
jgi:hypothetical protein